MTARTIYEAILIELNKNNAPSLRLHEFNYLFNKAVNELVDEFYTNYDVNQNATDSLRVLQSEAQLTPHKVVIKYPQGSIDNSTINTNITNGIPKVITSTEQKLKGATYEVYLPEDYLHILNCTCIYYVRYQNKCYDAGDYIEIPATKLTADSWSTIMTDVYNRPSPMKPYYYIHNRNTSADLPTNPVKDKVIDDKTTIEVGNDLDVYYTYTEVSDGGISSTRSKPNTEFQPTIYYSKDLENWYKDKNFTVAATISNFNQNNVQTVQKEPFSRTISLNKYVVNTVEKPAYLRHSNPQKVRMEIRYGKDNSVYELVEVRVDYVKSPQFIRLTQDQIDLTTDTSQIMEFPDYICQKIINKLVALLLERSSDPRLATNVQINRTMVSPTQPQTQQA